MFEELIKLLYNRYDKKFLTFMLLGVLISTFNIFNLISDFNKLIKNNVNILILVVLVIVVSGIYFLIMDVLIKNLGKVFFDDDAFIQEGFPIENKKLIISMLLIPSYIYTLPSLILSAFYKLFLLISPSHIEITNILIGLSYETIRLQESVYTGLSGIFNFTSAMTIVAFLLVAMCVANSGAEKNSLLITHIVFIGEVASMGALSYLLALFLSGNILAYELVLIPIKLGIISLVIKKTADYLERRADLG